jgi:hypothetical protein
MNQIELNIIQSSKYQNFFNQTKENILDDIHNSVTKKPVTKYEEKIKKVIHQLIQKKSVKEDLKRMINLSEDSRYILYQKISKKIKDQNENMNLLSLLNVTEWKNKKNIEKAFESEIKNYMDGSGSELRSSDKIYLHFFENLLFEYNFYINEDSDIIVDQINKIKAKKQVENLDVLIIMNIRYHLDRVLPNIRYFLNTPLIKQILYIYSHQILNRIPYLDPEYKDIYLLLESNISKVSNLISELKNMKLREVITLQDYIFLIWMKYYVDEIKSNKPKMFRMVKEEYYFRVKTDIQMHDEYTFTEMSNTPNFISILDKLWENTSFIRFDRMTKDRILGYLNQWIDINFDPFETFEMHVDFQVPYDIIIKNIKDINQKHINEINISIPLDLRKNIYSIQDVFLDVERFDKYDNFNIRLYLDELFLGPHLHPFHKIMLLLKSVFFSVHKQIIYYFKVNQNRLKIEFNEDIVESFLNQNENPNVFTKILPWIPFNYLESSIDFIIYYYYFCFKTIPNNNLIKERLSFFNYPIQMLDQSIILGGQIIQTFPTLNTIDKISFYNSPTNSSEKFILNGVYSLYLDNMITFYNDLFYPKQNFYDVLVNEIFLNKESDVSGELIDISQNLLGSNAILNNLIQNTQMFQSLNLDKIDLDHYILNHNEISLTSKWLYLIYNPSKNRIDISNNFGGILSDYFCDKIYQDNILSEVSNLFVNKKVTAFGILYFIIDYSLGLNIKTEAYGKQFSFDIVSDICLNQDKFKNELSKKLIQFPVLQNLISLNTFGKILAMDIYDNLFKNYFNSGDFFKFRNIYYLYQRINNKVINKNNYTDFIQYIIERNVSNPFEYLKIIQNYSIESETANMIRETIKRNFSQILSVDFYKDYVLQTLDPSGNIDIQVFHTLGNLLKLNAMSEDEFFEVMLQSTNKEIELYNGVKIYYDFNKDPMDYISVKEQNNYLPKFNLSPKVENILELTKMMNFEKIRILPKNLINESSLSTNISRTEEEIEKELQKSSQELRESIEADPDPDEVKEKKYIESGDVQSMLEYLKLGAKKRGFDLNRYLQEYMIGFMLLQLWLSMFDPTQVLSDYLVERILNQQVLGDFIKEEKDSGKYIELYMDLTTYPSSLVANNMYNNLKELLIRKGIPVTKDNMLNQLATWTEDEKWEIEKTGFLASKQFLEFIHNNNEIRYSGNPQLSPESNITKITYQNPKLMVKPGGSGLLEIRKI